MKLLKVRFDHLRMFEGGVFDIDLYASDRVPADDGSVTELSRPVYTSNLVALAGINASGKTTALNLLELACRIVGGSSIRGGGLPASLAGVFDGAFEFRCLVWHGGRAYLVESAIGPSPEGDEEGLAFLDETVSAFPARALGKSSLASWEGLSGRTSELYRRSRTDGDVLVLASPDVSVCAAAIAEHSGVPVRVRAIRDEGFSLREGFDGLDDVLRVFDPSIEHLEVLDSGRAFRLTFAGSEPVILSRQGLSEVLSSGTARGLGLVRRTVSAFQCGGYLLVDEIENHLNRQLVNVVLDLFASRETNPRGATLVFTTHYPQLLDHVHRKDNVFFLARGAGGSQVVKYCDRVGRIENKKSDVFASNYVRGTAPRYADVRALKGLVKRSVADE